MSAFDKFQHDWDELAELDPMWAICSVPDKMHGKWDVDEFFATGRDQIRNELKKLLSLGVRINTGTALDFGCGMGRLTQALAETFNKVYGVDISQKMVHYASQYNKHGDKCTYILNTRRDLQIFEANHFDFIYTYIVLQHMPPDMMLEYLKEFIRILKAGGILMFQVPVLRLEKDTKAAYLRSLPKYHPRRILNKLEGIILGHNETDRYYKMRKLRISKTWLYKVFGFHPEIQMHTLEESRISTFLVEHGMEIVHVTREEDISSKMLHAEFIATKPS